jgi:release factor glutamine methyltransferase
LNPVSKPLLDILNSGAAYLDKKGVEEARLNMEHLLAHVLGCRRLDLYLRFAELLPETELAPLRELLRRRGEGEPLQHLLGNVDFCDHVFICDHRGLIPRPETEYLVEIVLKWLAGSKPARLLDVGTGSGCLGISLALATGASTVLVDISEEALDLARLNVSRLARGAAIQTVRSDLFEKVTGTFDLIVANLPYIPRAEIATLSREVRRDPPLALDGGPVGTEIIFRLLEDAPVHLALEGRIAIEHAHDQSPAITQKAAMLGYRDLEVVCDLAGVERFLLAKAPPAPPFVEQAPQDAEVPVS